MWREDRIASQRIVTLEGGWCGESIGVRNRRVDAMRIIQRAIILHECGGGIAQKQEGIAIGQECITGRWLPRELSGGWSPWTEER